MNMTKITQTIIKTTAVLLIGLAGLALISGTLDQITGSEDRPHDRPLPESRSDGGVSGLRVLALAVGTGGPLLAAYLIAREFGGGRSPGPTYHHRLQQPTRRQLDDGEDGPP